jgi:ribose transport system permease protein
VSSLSGLVTPVRGWRPPSAATLLRTYGVIVALVILVLAVEARESAFLSLPNLRNITSQWAPAGIMAIGVTFVLLTGGLDLSFAANFSLSAIVAAYLGSKGTEPGVCFLAAMGVGLGIGVINGALIGLADINSFIATLGVSFALTSAAQILTSNVPYVVTNPAYQELGTGRLFTIPYPSLILLGLLVLGGRVLARTVYGQQVYAVGGNQEASRLAGIRVKTVIASTFVISGFCAGLAGAIASSQLGSAQGNLDPSVLFDVITIVILGGTSLAGGFGAMWRTAAGLGMIAAISNGFDLLGVDPNYQSMAKGGILVAALVLDSYARRLARKSEAKRTGTQQHQDHQARANSPTPSHHSRTAPAGTVAADE